MNKLTIIAEEGVSMEEATHVAYHLVKNHLVVNLAQRATVMFTTYGNNYSVTRDRNDNLKVTGRKGKQK